MNNTTKYNIPDQISDKVSESLGVANTSGTIRSTYSPSIYETDNLNDNVEIKSLQYSLEELNDRISDGIELYHQGIYYTQEEAHAILDRWISEV